MPPTEEYTFDIAHPAPARGRVSNWAIFFAVAAGAFAWGFELCTIASLSGAACFVGDGPSDVATSAGWAHPAIIGVNLAAIAVGVAALVLSLRGMASAGPTRLAGSNNVLEEAQGRVRYLSAWGLFASVLFILATAFNTVAVFWGGLCVT